MVNVTCEKCGSQHSLEEPTIPPSGKVIKCPACAHSITIMPPDASAAGLRAPLTPSPGGPPRSPTMAGVGGSLPPKIPSKGKLLGGPALAAFDDDDGADAGAFGGGSALADVPLPKRASPLAGASGRARETHSPLEGIGGGSAQPPASPLSASAGDIVDLPAPKRPGDEIVDLPAPKRPAADFADLPAPVGPSPTKSGGLTDLLAPKRPGDEIVDLPAPKRPAADFTDLPAPKRPTADIADLPAPVGPSPTKGGTDLPAPKGFFADVPAPSPTPAAAPKSTQLGLGADLPAPKGFFDDVPGPAAASAKPGGGLDLPAPKGFFDDIPAPPASRGPAPPASRGPAPPVSAAAAPAPAAGGGVLDLDDLDLEPSKMAPLPRAPVGEPDGGGAEPPALDLGSADADSPFALDALELDGASPNPLDTPAVPLELPSLDGGDQFSDMELPSLSAGAPPPTDGLVTFSASPSKPASAPPPLDVPEPLSARPKAADAGLELAIDTARPKRATVAPAQGDVVARVEPPTAEEIAEQGDADGKPAKKKKKKASSKRQRLISIAAAVVVVLGAGGFYGFTQWQSKKDLERRLSTGIAAAKKHLHADRWDKAADAALSSLQIDANNADALGLAAQAYYADAIDRGAGAKALIAKGEEQFEQIVKVAAKGPEIDRAKALRALTEQQPPQAIKLLDGVAKKEPNDGTIQLYLGWAHTAANDPASALKALDGALKRSPKRVPALYGKGMSHLALGQIKEARAAFLGVLEVDKEHIGAQVGVAQIIEVDRFNDRENRYLEILQRPDLAQRDPRAVSRAWSLAGDEALRAGRVDEALARYAKALELHPDNIGAQVGEGKAALVQGRVEEALERLGVALKQQPNNVDGLLAFAQASYRLDKWDDAINALETSIKIAPQDWRIYMVYGEVLEHDPQADPAEAEGAYKKAIEMADKSEIAPTVALSKLLVAQDRGREALAVLEPIETAAEEDAPLAVTLGVAYLGTGEPARAEEWFRKALARRPNDIEGQLQLGLALHAQGRVEEAIETLKAAYEASDGREDVGVRLALIYEAQEMNDAADALYGRLLENPAVSINVRGRAGRFYTRTGKTEKAVSLGELILAENDRNAAGHFLRAEGLFLQREYQEAQKEYREAVLIDPTAQYFEGLGRAGEALQLYDDARDAFNRAIGIDGKYVQPRIGLGRIKYRRLEFADALDELLLARELDDRDPQVHFYIGECYYQTDRPREAAAAYIESLRRDDKDPYVHYRLGMAYVDLDRARDAAAAFRRATDMAEGTEVKWLPEAYRLLGYSARTAGERALAIKGFRAFLDMAPPTSPEAKDVKKLLLRLEAGGR